MTFGRFLGFATAASLFFAASAWAQTGNAPATPAAAEPSPATSNPQPPTPATPTSSTAADVTPAPEAAPAPMAELTDAHGAAQPGDAKAGASKAAACAACHGADGNASDPQYPKLAGQHERYIARQLALFKSGERANPIMMGFAAPLSPQDMRDIGAHFSQQKALPGVADETVIAQGPNQGRKFFEVGQRLWRGGDAGRGIPACQACHGPDGRGNPGPAYPAIAGQHAGYTAAQLTAFRAGTSYGTGERANLVMAGVSKYLTDEDIQSLASYIQGLHTAPAEVAGAR
jgi:cytochrome c553